MRLKSIKLAGFKSFVDPTTVSFPSNMAAVVGPNGCGKSNIIDAVRWVMGESSAKNLRGESMTDVIFNGSNTRKPVTQASIELIFDNSDNSLVGEYAAFAEISIRRRVTRDGQNTYFLNGTKCRRRDITDIFLGTGLGPRSYSIIEQGMISKLIEAKPEELRNFIEEAAGISKYKERRRETENRIRRTQENLARLTDLREELERQLERLHRQAQAAEKYQEYKAEERQLKAQLLALRWQTLNQQVGSREQVIGDQEVAFEALVAEQRSADAAIERLRDGHHELSERFNLVQGRFYSVGGDIATHGIEAPLYQIETLGEFVMAVTQALDGSVGTALLGHQRLESDFLVADHLLAAADLLVQGLPAQGQQLGLELTLLGLVFLVLLRRLSLTVQAFELALQLLAQVGQARQVLLGAADTVLGLATALLVLGDAGGFLDEIAQLLGLGLDQLADHALLDDRVAARPQTGAEEDIGDIAATALGAVEEIGVLPVTGDPAADGNLGEGGVFAHQRVVAVVEDQLDGGLGHRLARVGAVEDDVGHRLAAQVLRRTFAHHPAHGVDDVGLAATVGPDHRRHVAGKAHRRRIDEGLEAGQLDAFQAHLGLALGQGRQHQLAIVLAIGLQHLAGTHGVAGDDRLQQAGEGVHELAHLAFAPFQRQVIGAADSRQQVLQGFLQVGVVGEGEGGAHHVEAALDEGTDIATLEAVLQAPLDIEERRQIGFHLPALDHRTGQHGVQLDAQRVEAGDVMRGQFTDLGAAARQDHDQVAALENQQRLAHRTAADVECLGDLLLLDALAFLELTANDAVGQVMGNLLGEAVRGLERHDIPYLRRSRGRRSSLGAPSLLGGSMKNRRRV